MQWRPLLASVLLQRGPDYIRVRLLSFGAVPMPAEILPCDDPIARNHRHDAHTRNAQPLVLLTRLGEPAVSALGGEAQVASDACLAEALTLHGRQRRRPHFDIKEAINTVRPEGLRLLHPSLGELKALLGIILGNLDLGTSGSICDAHLAHLVLNGACATLQIQACLLDDVGVRDAVLAVRLTYHAAAGVKELAKLALGDEILASTTTVLGAAPMREAVDVRVDGLDGDLINTRFQALRIKRAPCMGTCLLLAHDEVINKIHFRLGEVWSHV